MMKRFFLLILAIMMLIAAVGCGAKPTDGEMMDNEAQSEAVGESAVQDEETLKANDEAVIAYFQNILNHTDVITADEDPSRQAEYNTLCIVLQFLFFGDTIEQVLDDGFSDFMANDEAFNFLHSSDEIASITVYDLSNEGKKEVIGIIREIYNTLGGEEFTDPFVGFWGGKCLPIAENLHELHGEDLRTKELKEEYFKPHWYHHYYGAYAELLLGEETE